MGAKIRACHDAAARIRRARPEHSSGRVERFLQLAAENNWTVANVSTAGQYFHILRRQAKWLAKEEIRPLVLMTPKSLLRHPLASVEPSVLVDGKFHTVLEGRIRKIRVQSKESCFAAGKWL